MVDKPGRRKKSTFPWKKIATWAVVVLLAVAAGWYIYTNYVYKAPPIYARIDTSDGAFYVVLYPQCAPQTVSKIVGLADSGFYNDLVWHRIVGATSSSPAFVIQTGDPHSRGGLNSTRSSWGEGFNNMTGLTASDLAADLTVPLEVGRCPDLGTYQGYLGMARAGNFTTGLNTGSTQFFINLSNSTSNLQISGHYTVFGKVISGWSVVQAIAKSPICQAPTCPSRWPADEPLPAVFMNDFVILSGPNVTTA
jgi:cyclophilin family peptidyl-prolyl cis-trans isomerase